MKISIDKDFTTISQAPKVKNDLKEFKARYTDGDLLRVFREAAEIYGYCTGEILSCDVKGFPAGTYYIIDGDDEPTHFAVDMLIDEKYIEIDRIRFYCDMNLDVHLETTFNGKTHKMYDVERYIRQR